MGVHGRAVYGGFILEKKVKRISVRVPSSWKSRLEASQVKISEVVRSALWLAICKCETDSPGARKITSKEAAARLFNELSEVRVRTLKEKDLDLLISQPVKLRIFAIEIMSYCGPDELISLGEFMNQGEYAEEILREAYK